MSSDLAIQTQNISKHFLMFEKPEHRLKQMIVPKLQRLAGQDPKRYYRDFVAVNDVSLKIERGATVGIIGRNGSGKSTLLQMICGTLQPSHGSVQVNGRIAALLELGAGFNPEFTGRENVYMNAAILGLSRKETEDRFEEIERFADIGIFIDQPVKSYSSGMYVRLAFAVAINVKPDILIVDEALAVGDEAFQRKCFARIEQIKENGATILFVSHGAQTIVQLCDRAILMDRGEVILDGVPKTVVNQYQRFVNLSGDEAEPVREEVKAMDGWVKVSEKKPQELTSNTDDNIEPEKELSSDKEEGWFDPNLKSESVVEYESKGANISDVKILAPSGRQVNVLKMGKKYTVYFKVFFQETSNNVGFSCFVKTREGGNLAGASSYNSHNLRVKSVKKDSTYIVSFSFYCRFLPDTYFLNCGVFGQTEKMSASYLHRLIDIIIFKVDVEKNLLSIGQFDLTPKLTLSLSQNRDSNVR